MSDQPAITVNNLNKNFRLPHEQHNSLKQTVLNWHKRSYETLEALNDISFQINQGEFFGIVGRNGSGKSTLLKTIAGIYTPNQGEIAVNGQLTPFIELGVGFDPELTGRDNVFLNGAILGLSREEVAEIYDDIVRFAELEKFMDQKLKNYSSGMQVRLAFSIAIRAHNEILMIDEVLAVGDANFQRKCFNFFKEAKKTNQTIVFVSHDMEAIQEYCDRAILLIDGRLTHEGDPKDVARAYNEVNFRQAGHPETDQTKAPAQKKEDGHFGTGDLLIKDIYAVDDAGERSNFFAPNEDIAILVEVEAKTAVDSPLVGTQIENTDGVVVAGTNTEAQEVSTPNLAENDKLYCKWSFKNIYGDGTYYLSAAVKSQDRSTQYDQVGKIGKFEVAGWSGASALVHTDHKLEVEKA